MQLSSPPEGQALARSTRQAIVLLAVLQSALLLFAHESIERGGWLANHDWVLIAWYTLTLAVPTTWMLLLHNVRQVAPWFLGLGRSCRRLPISAQIVVWRLKIALTVCSPIF